MGLKQVKSIWNNGALWSAVAVLVNSAMNFLVIPIVSERLGIEAYGYVTLANTMITYIDVISLAINSFASRYIAMEYHDGNFLGASRYYSTVFFADLALSVLIVVFSFVFILNIQRFLVISSALVAEVKLLFLIVFIRYVFVLMRSVFEVPAFIKNRLYMTERFRSYSYFIQATILVVTCVVIPARIWYVGMASAAAAVFMFLAEIRIAHSNIPELRIKPADFEWGKLKRVLSSGMWNSINNLGNLLNSGLDLLITNRMLTETALGMISVSKTFGSMCYILANAISNSFKPRQLQYYSQNDILGLINHFKRSMRITGSVCAIIIVGFICCGKEFLRLWIPGQDVETIYVLSVIVLFGDIITGVVNPLFYTYTLTNRIKLPCMITIALGTINVVSMYLLIRFASLGMYAIILTTVVLNLVHFIDAPLYSAHCLKIPFRTFYPTIFLHLINVAVSGGTMWALNLIYPMADTWFKLLIKIMIFGGCTLLMSVVIVTTKDEKTAIMRRLSAR